MRKRGCGFYSLSIVTIIIIRPIIINNECHSNIIVFKVAVSCIICDKRVIGRKWRNFYTPPVFSAQQGMTPSEFREDICGEKKLQQHVKPFPYRTDGRTDRQIDRQN